MSAFTQSLLLVVAIVTLIMLATIGFTFYAFVWKWLRSLMRRKPPHMVDVTNSEFFTPALIQAMARELEELGFQQDVIAEVHLPEHKAVANVWYYVNSEKDIVVEVIEYGDKAALQFSTWYDDDSAIETGYPIGENFDTRNFCSHFTKKSISDAYRLHQEQMRKFTTKKFRVPMRISSLDMYIELEAKYQVTHKPVKFRRGLMRGLGLFISFNILAAAFLVANVFDRIPDLLLYIPQPVLVLGQVVIGLALVSLIFFMAINRHHGGA